MILRGFRTRSKLALRPLYDPQHPDHRWQVVLYGDAAGNGVGPVVRTFPGQAKSRRVYRVPLGPRIRFGAHDNDLMSLLRAVIERSFVVKNPRYDGVDPLEDEFVPPPQPAPHRWDRIRLLSHQLRLPTTRPIQRRDFPALYDEPRKRRIYELAVLSLESVPVNRRDAVVRGFVKYEKTNFTAKPDPAPRLIQPRDPRYNVEVGVFLKPVEHTIYHAIDNMFSRMGCVAPTVAKSHNFSRRAMTLHRKWIRFNRPVAFMFDAARFDQHVSVDALRFEHYVYLRMFRDDDRSRLAWLLSLQLYTVFKGRCGDGAVTFTKAGGRCSGDMNTSLGNVLLMCMMMADYILFLQALGVTKFELYDDGDDVILMVELEHRALVERTYAQFFLDLGFEMRLDSVATTLEEIEFCQAHPVFDGERWTMIRDPRVAIAKDCISTLPHPTEKVLRGWMAAVADCGEAIAGRIPVWDTFYSTLRKHSNGAKALRLPDLESGMFQLSKGMRRKFGEVSPLARVSFWRAFGWTPEYQEKLESWFRIQEIQTGMDTVRYAVPNMVSDSLHTDYLLHCTMPMCASAV